MIYLDYNATTPVAPEVVAAMADYWTEKFYNPSSPYPEADAVCTALETARLDLSTLLEAEPDTLVFTSGGTESNNWLLRSVTGARRQNRPRVIASAIEHPAVAQTLEALKDDGAEVVIVPVDERGLVRLDVLEEVLDERTALVSVMLANNEIGTLQPVTEIARLAHAAGAWVHTDAAQAIGKVPVHVRDLDVDFLTVVGHKFYGPKGIGALYIRRGQSLRPLLAGGGQERGRRGGTENVPAIVGLGAAARLAVAWLGSEGPARQARLRDQFEAVLRRQIPDCRVFGQDAPRVPNTSAFSLPGWTGRALLAACPTIRAATGSACHSEDETGSPTLRAMGVQEAVVRGLVRVSLGRETTPEAIGQAAAALVQAAESGKAFR
ncbi:cysteine desulfurase family protein [Alicyclobacillus sp. SP_1]|uniref:cysteine desulfurase family protein n=1 Tax=Alicyclobacillus sp. SP_1 TaxID=2942475 RepID=UPI0021574E0F|nr:cysteine desulfurase family protein [Alicyclobacillus sp. SP_1]